MFKVFFGFVGDATQVGKHYVHAIYRGMIHDSRMYEY